MGHVVTAKTEHERQQMQALSKALGRRLRAARHARGWSMQDVADLLGLCKASIFRYEKGSTEMSLTCLVRLSRLYGVPVAQLIDPAACAA